LGANPSGTVITSINRTPIGSVADYNEAVKALEPGDVVGVDLYIPEAEAEMPLTIAIPR
jgi:S1-C subfamily serine protease